MGGKIEIDKPLFVNGLSGFFEFLNELVVKLNAVFNGVVFGNNFALFFGGRNPYWSLAKSIP